MSICYSEQRAAAGHGLEQEERALNTMSELLHALLNIAKLESGTLQATLSDVSVPVVFDDLRQQFSALAKLKKLDLVVVASDMHLHTDQVLLTEMLQNLLANALRYTDRRRVTLSCVPHAPGRALIEVADTGIGIPEAVQARIFFDDFFPGSIAGRRSPRRCWSGAGHRAPPVPIAEHPRAGDFNGGYGDALLARGAAAGSPAGARAGAQRSASPTIEGRRSCWSRMTARCARPWARICGSMSIECTR